MKKCKCERKRHRKMNPYGQKKSKSWCISCDCNIIPNDPNKTLARRLNKFYIEEGIKDYLENIME